MKIPFSIHLNSAEAYGTVMFWLGLLVCAASIVILLSVSRITLSSPPEGVPDGEGETLTFPHVDMVQPSWRARSISLVPMAAGILLILAGMATRSWISDLREEYHREKLFTTDPPSADEP